MEANARPASFDTVDNIMRTIMTQLRLVVGYEYVREIEIHLLSMT
jgi:hypothetical protein